MKKIVPFILFIALQANFSFGQIGLEVFHYRPTGNIGDAMKPTVGLELDYVNDFNGYVRFRAGINAVFLKSRLDTIPIYSVEYDFSKAVVSPGFQVFRAYRVFTVAAGADFRFFESDTFNPYLGIDGTFGYIRYRYDYEDGASFGTDMGNLLHYGIRPRVGVEYNISDSFVLFAQFTRNMYIVRGVGPQGYNSYGIGARLNIW